MRERSTLEKEYATKLLALAKKAGEKRARRINSVALGAEPAVAWNDDTLKER